MASRPALELAVRAFALLAVGLLPGSPLLSANMAAPAHPVVPMYEQIGDAESIADHNVNVLAMDARGLLLVGTPAGLVRHDGYSFRRSRNPDPVVGNFVLSLAADAGGGVWAGTQNGLFRLDAAFRGFTNYRHEAGNPDSLPGGAIRGLLSTPDGGLWLGAAYEGAVRMVAGANRFERVAAPDVGARGLVGAFFAMDSLERLWIGSESGLHRVDDLSRAQAAAVELAGAAASGLKRAPISALFLASDGHLWIGTSIGGLYVLDPSQSPATVHEFDPGGGPEHLVSGFAQADRGHLWVGRLSGLELRNLAGYLTSAETGAVGLRISPPTTEVLTLLRDSSGVVWTGGHNSGLRRLAPVNTAVRRIQPGLSAGVPAINVESVMVRRNGDIWLGSRQRGIAVLDRDLRLRSGPFPGISLANGLDVPQIGAMLEATDGTIWIGAADGAHLHDPVGGRTWQAPRAASAQIGPVRRLTEGRGGEIYVGAQNGLFCYDRIDAPPRQVPLGEGDALRVAINAFAWDPQGRLWVGSRGGLFVFESGSLRQVSAPSATTPLPHEITGLLSDRSGRLWIDTSTGLFRLQSVTANEIHFDAISERLGFGDEPFGANLLEDARGRIWTHRHIYDPQTDHIENLTLADGLILGRFRSHAQSVRGELLFGDSEGLAVVNPERYSTWSYHPPVVLTDLRIDGIERAFTPADAITLSAEARGFTAEFAALDYSAPQRLRYAFRLEGYEDAWRQTGAQQRIAAYANLWPGDYTLHVRGSNRNGVFSSHELRVPVRILPAWWQTPWFVLLALLAVTALGWTAVRWRTLRLRARAAELGALVEARTAELRQSNVDLARSKREVESAHARLVNTQQQLVLQEKMAALGTLTAGVAHEINNPTNFADGAVQQLQLQHAQLHQFLRELAGADASPRVLEAIAERFRELAEMTSTAREGHQRIKRIVADLRQFTRLDEAEKKSVPVADPIQSTVNLVRTRFDRIRFQLDLDFNPSIECQPAKLGQVFMNLVMNACEAIGECGDGRAGVVHIATRAIDRAVEIAIEDNGAGMDEVTRQHVFEPFFTTKDVGSGTGLGLAIVFGIVKDHGGSIELTSTPGSGTRFTLRLPITADRAD